MRFFLFLFIGLLVNTGYAQNRYQAKDRGFPKSVVQQAIDLTPNGECLLLIDGTFKCRSGYNVAVGFEKFLTGKAIIQLLTWSDRTILSGGFNFRRTHLVALTSEGDLVASTAAFDHNGKFIGSAFMPWDSGVDKVIETMPGDGTSSPIDRHLILIKKNEMYQGQKTFFNSSNWASKPVIFNKTPADQKPTLGLNRLENILSSRLGFATPSRPTFLFQVFTDGDVLDCVWCGHNVRNVQFKLPFRVNETGKIGSYYGDFFVVSPNGDLETFGPPIHHRSEIENFKKVYNGRLKFTFGSNSYDGGHVTFITKDGEVDFIDNGGFGDNWYKYSSEPMIVSTSCAITKNQTVECAN